MTPDFVRRFAPKLQLMDNTPRGGLDPEQGFTGGTPRPYIQVQGGPREYFGERDQSVQSAGITPEQGFTGSTPRPYLQEQGGTRQYFGPRLEDEPSAVAGLRATTSQQELRAHTPSGLGIRLPDRPGADIEVPQNMLTQNARRPVTTRIAPEGPEGQIVEGIRSGRIDPARGRFEQNLTALSGVLGELGEGATLSDMLRQFNFQLPSFLRTDELRGRTAVEAATTAPRDQRYIRNATTLYDLPNFATTEGVAEFNRRMRLNVSYRPRTLTQQAALRAQGATTVEDSFHPMDLAIDVRPREMGGLRGQAAVTFLYNRADAAGYPVDRMQFIWKSGRGAGQGTGPHVHIEPIGSPSQYRSE